MRVILWLPDERCGCPTAAPWVPNRVNKSRVIRTHHHYYYYISSIHSNLNFAHHFVICWMFQNGANKNQHQDSYQRETVSDKFVFFFSKLVRQKMSIAWAKYVYICEWDMCWRNFCYFPWWLKNVKSRSKIALFSNECHFEIWFPKIENKYVFLK